MKGSILSDYRTSRRMTIMQLSREIGINPATLHKLEHNRGFITARRVIRWCEDHEIKPADVFPTH